MMASWPLLAALLSVLLVGNQGATAVVAAAAAAKPSPARRPPPPAPRPRARPLPPPAPVPAVKSPPRHPPHPPTAKPPSARQPPPPSPRSAPATAANVIVTIPYDTKLRNILPDWDIDDALAQLIPLDPTHLR